MSNKYKNRDQYSSAHSFRDSRRKRRNARINKAYSYAERQRRGCQVTGLPCHPDDLEWHHIQKPTFKIGSGYHRSFQSFKAELDKCISVMVDVHVLLHQGEISFDESEIIPP